MRNALYTYCEAEYTSLDYILNQHKTNNAFAWVHPYESVQNAIQRCLGASNFAQEQGLSYEEAEQIYNFFTKKMRGLLDK